MIDQSRQQTAQPYTAQLADFSPVPRQCKRHDGWTPDRQKRFITALADLGSVKAAAHAVNMSPDGAYMLRRHPEADEFRQAWEAALALGVQRLEDVAMERALFGVEVPVFHFGAVVGTRRVYNDRLLMFLLRNRAPTRFAADSARNASASATSQLERLKREWKAQWEKEQFSQQQASSEEVTASIDAKLELMHDRWLASLTKRTRALYDAYQAAEEEDKAARRSAFTEQLEEERDGGGE
jgi:hypothetical protein